jgi:hypothetical protein
MKQTKPTEQELDLDKFMANLTAKESPDAVIYTIVGDKTKLPTLAHKSARSTPLQHDSRLV